MADVSDWISTASSVAGAVVGIITLLTVYIGAMQLISQARMYRLGLSWRSIGPWQSIMARWALLGLQRHVSVPVVSLKLLVRKHWQPDITFPAGYPRNRDECVEKGIEKVQAKTSWVNFMQALGLSPDDNDSYEMHDAPDLVNGMVPMPWTGRDLAGICSILGFQSHEGCPSFSSPMPLPMQWSGPLGWIQFRSSSNGCVAEFRRRMDLHNQISSHLHAHHFPENPNELRQSDFLRSRLWNSINGFALENGHTLYIGGADEHARPQEMSDGPDLSEKELFRDLTSRDLTEGEIMSMLFGRKEKRPKALQVEAERKERAMTAPRPMGRDGHTPDFLNSVLRDKMDACKKKQVLRPCPGLLSVLVEGELAYNRGLAIQTCHEYDRKYTDAEDVDHAKYPHSLGDLYMDTELLGLVKEAILLLQPDGFFFSPTYVLYRDVCQVYQHIEDQSNALQEQVFPSACIAALEQLREPPPGGSQSSSACPCAFHSLQRESHDCLRFAMALCNDLQRTRKTARACFTVEDMQLLTKAASALQCTLGQLSGPGGHPADLVWAVLCCRELPSDVLKMLRADGDTAGLLSARVTCRGSVLDCAALSAAYIAGDGGDEMAGQYRVPLLADGEFTGEQVLIALSIVFITYYWIETAWKTDVAAYDTTMPQSVLMC